MVSTGRPVGSPWTLAAVLDRREDAFEKCCMKGPWELWELEEDVISMDGGDQGRLPGGGRVWKDEDRRGRWFCFDFILNCLCLLSIEVSYCQPP